jgi:hypothetical protein
MSGNSHGFLYKYRAITNHNLNEDYSLDALLNNYAVFSGRKNFNDLFDTKIDLINAAPKAVRDLRTRPPSKRRYEIDRCVSKGVFTNFGISYIRNLKQSINDLIDSYPIYCVSEHPDSNLLWAHYAASHTGFCLEFSFDQDELPHEVSYQSQIASLNLLDFFEQFHELNDPEEWSSKILGSLLVKLEEWRYEKEHRWIAAIQKIPQGQKFIKLNNHRLKPVGSSYGLKVRIRVG